MNNWQQYIPHVHTIIWMFGAMLLLWKLSTFMDAILEAISEQKADGTRGKVSIKRIIPFIFTLLICYMVIGCMHNAKKEFNTTAFVGLMLFIAIATTVITVAQANGFLDKINILKGKTTESSTTTSSITSTHKKEEDHSSDNP